MKLTPARKRALERLGGGTVIICASRGCIWSNGDGETVHPAVFRALRANRLLKKTEDFDVYEISQAGRRARFDMMHPDDPLGIKGGDDA